MCPMQNKLQSKFQFQRLDYENSKFLLKRVCCSDIETFDRVKEAFEKIENNCFDQALANIDRASIENLKEAVPRRLSENLHAKNELQKVLHYLLRSCSHPVPFKSLAAVCFSKQDKKNSHSLNFESYEDHSIIGRSETSKGSELSINESLMLVKNNVYAITESNELLRHQGMSRIHLQILRLFLRHRKLSISAVCKSLKSLRRSVATRALNELIENGLILRPSHQKFFTPKLVSQSRKPFPRSPEKVLAYRQLKEVVSSRSQISSGKIEKLLFFLAKLEQASFNSNLDSNECPKSYLVKTFANSTVGIVDLIHLLPSFAWSFVFGECDSLPAGEDHKELA